MVGFFVFSYVLNSLLLQTRSADTQAEPAERKAPQFIVLAHHQEAIQFRRTQIRGSDSSDDDEEEADDIEWGPATELGAPPPVGAPGHLHPARAPRAPRGWRKEHVDVFIRDARVLISADVREASVCLFVRVSVEFSGQQKLAEFSNLPPKISAASLPPSPASSSSPTGG
ncbi:hypothetical protein fugu_005650 [Takifugu bimaculatus]|uniref:Uncharacterized protein n=1 Tax=Takifugu bimaculatus TaxID=433685 RepID=A0A4Z2B6L5_9TELE|nr:hypothetical protein fugu_005650 [Takifugu bimaculatus]